MIRIFIAAIVFFFVTNNASATARFLDGGKCAARLADSYIALSAESVTMNHECFQIGPKHAEHYAAANTPRFGSEREDFERAKIAPLFSTVLNKAQHKLDAMPRDQLDRQCSLLPARSVAPEKSKLAHRMRYLSTDSEGESRFAGTEIASGIFSMDADGELEFRQPGRREAIGFSNQDTALKALGSPNPAMIDTAKICGWQIHARIQISGLITGRGPARIWRTTKFVRVIKRRPLIPTRCD